MKYCESKPTIGNDAVDQEVELMSPLMVKC